MEKDDTAVSDPLLVVREKEQPQDVKKCSFQKNKQYLGTAPAGTATVSLAWRYLYHGWNWSDDEAALNCNDDDSNPEEQFKDDDNVDESAMGHPDLDKQYMEDGHKEEVKEDEEEIVWLFSWSWSTKSILWKGFNLKSTQLRESHMPLA